MKVITAPETIDNIKRNDILVFLAGGITNCQDWRTPVISHLDKVYGNDNHIVIFNPRREGFNIFNEAETYNQIKWEYKALIKCDIFTMLFCESKSVQPICMYELGKQLAQNDYVYGDARKIIHTLIGVEEKYSRKEDVIIQSNLMGYPVDVLRGSKEQRYADFANKIIFRVNSLLNKS